MLSQIEKALRQLHLPSQPRGLYEPIDYVLDMGGKRLRPQLLLRAYSLFRSDYEQALPAAIGIETYHNHTLLHDDLMDSAHVRRGKPTVHQKWNTNTAILSGDTMLLLAYRLITSTTVGRRHEALQLFTQSAIEICEGQQYDINFETQTEVTLEQYIEMIRLKTSVLLGCAAKMGGLLANATDADCNTLYDFAEKLGLAFQLQDDYLDAFGDESVFGKKIGGDILCGKKTYLMHATTQHMDKTERIEFLSLLNRSDVAHDDKIKRVTAIYRQYHAPESCQTAIQQYFDEAHSALQRLSVNATPLWEYAQTLMNRQK